MNEAGKKFFVFHDWGVSVYEPGNCRLLHMIQSTDIMPGTQVSQLPPPPTLAIGQRSAHLHPDNCTIVHVRFPPLPGALHTHEKAWDDWRIINHVSRIVK